MIFTEAFSPTSKAKINSSGDREWVLWGRAEPKICVCGKGKHVYQISGTQHSNMSTCSNVECNMLVVGEEWGDTLI